MILLGHDATSFLQTVRGDRHSPVPLCYSHIKEVKERERRASVITVEKVSSWRFCSDPADSPIPLHEIILDS